MRLEKIVGLIKLAELDRLDKMAREEPIKLSDLLKAPDEEIMEALPGEFAECSFF